jgi:hypothetical protein
VLGIGRREGIGVHFVPVPAPREPPPSRERLAAIAVARLLKPSQRLSAHRLPGAPTVTAPVTSMMSLDAWRLTALVLPVSFQFQLEPQES